MKPYLVLFVAFALAACSEPAEERDIFDSVDGGQLGGTGGSSGGNGSSNGDTNNVDPECADEYGELACIEEDHFRLDFYDFVVEDRTNETVEQSRGFAACGATRVAEQPNDQRAILAREGACVAYRGQVGDPFISANYDAGPIDLYSNEQVVNLVPGVDCYQPEVMLNPLFLEGETITIDVTGGTAVDPWVGDTRWPTSVAVGAVEVTPGSAFDIIWTSLEDDSEVVATIAAVDSEGVRTQIRCSARDSGDGAIEVPREVSAELPDEPTSVEVTLTRTQTELIDEDPAFYLVRQATTQVTQ